mgnify:CR=1 FL=1
MSIASPQNRDEFRQYVLTKLGAPVLEVNVADEQIDIAIEDAFQYFNERSHFYGTERMYLTFRQSAEFVEAFTSFGVKEVSQNGKNPSVPIPGRPTTRAEGMVDELTLVNPGEGYPSNAYPLTDRPTTEVTGEIEIQTQAGKDLQTEAAEDIIYSTTGVSTSGQGLTVNIGPQRTTKMGITTVTIYDTGYGYEVGDIIQVQGNSVDGAMALFEVSKIKTESPIYGNAPIQTQNNYIILPDDVVGVGQVMQSRSSNMAGILPPGALFPMMIGGMLGNDQQCGGQGYNLVSFVAMMEYRATLEFLFFPPIQYNFNQRTHKLYIDSNNFRGSQGAGTANSGKMIAIECMVKPSPDVYPDLWNDLWLKKYATALVKSQWGRNLTKYSQVNLPGGITMNGDQILQQGREEVSALEERFAMDWADPVLDEVG